ncbi:MAG: alpha/beta fold hydrolase [Frankia sp.]
MTADGQIGYRKIGSGTPILLVTGLGATMDNWLPSFVDALAAHHTVVVFDNAGVGRTSSLRSPLTIGAMTRETSQLITALRLGRTGVLGWSMGGMIAQALAVEHPSDVGALILAATQAGDGTARPVPAGWAATVAHGNPAQILATLFPASQEAATRTYVTGVLRYPGYYSVPAAVKTAQNMAVQQWIEGSDREGASVRRLDVPALVADGAEDVLDPMANARSLAAHIHGAQLALYPDAGHGFLFQYAAAFATRVNALLG